MSTGNGGVAVGMFIASGIAVLLGACGMAGTVIVSRIDTGRPSSDAQVKTKHSALHQQSFQQLIPMDPIIPPTRPLSSGTQKADEGYAPQLLPQSMGPTGGPSRQPLSPSAQRADGKSVRQGAAPPSQLLSSGRHGCDDIIHDFDNTVDIYVAEARHDRRAHDHPDEKYDKWDRVGKLKAIAMRKLKETIHSAITSRIPFQYTKTADDAKKMFKDSICAICGILHGTFRDRMTAHVARIDATLSRHTGKGPGLYNWLTDEARFYEDTQVSPRPPWDAADNVEASILHHFYTKAAENIGPDPGVLHVPKFITTTLPELKSAAIDAYDRWHSANS